MTLRALVYRLLGFSFAGDQLDSERTARELLRVRVAHSQPMNIKQLEKLRSGRNP